MNLFITYCDRRLFIRPRPLNFVTKVLLICFVAGSFKIAQLNCSFYFITVDYQHIHRSSKQS